MVSLGTKIKRELPAPEKGEPWTGITEKELIEKGFEKIVEVITDEFSFYHPKLELLQVKYDETLKSWYLIYRGCTLRLVKYMYQIDNMFHGFTDRWLGYI